MYLSPPSEDSINFKHPTVVFVHNMWGSSKSSHRHVRLLNSLGFPTVSFNLYKATSMKETLSPRIKFPPKFLSQYLVEQITDVLNSISGEKIIFAFSGPSMCAFIAAHDRADIRFFICDGGPFKDLWACTKRMFAQLTPIKTDFMHGLMSSVACFFWGYSNYEKFQTALNRWPKKIPILSIRGMKDSIVFPQDIAQAFEDHPQLPLTVIELAEAGHLDGLKKYPKDYEEVIKSFIWPSSSQAR